MIKAASREGQVDAARGRQVNRIGHRLGTSPRHSRWQINPKNSCRPIGVLPRQSPIAAADLQNAADLVRQHVQQVATLVARRVASNRHWRLI